MSKLFNARRAFFVGKTGKIINVLMVAAVLLGYPVVIQADTMATQTGSTAFAATSAIQPVAPALSIASSKTVWVTAYTSDPAETSDHPLITASGGMVHDGEVAANFLPFGTQIEIPSLFGNKIFTVEDRTSAKFSGRVDIWMPTVNQAIDFGIEHAQIVILDQNLALQ